MVCVHAFIAANGFVQYGDAVCGPVRQWAYGPVAACMWGGYANRSAKAEGQRQVNGREVCSRVRKKHIISVMNGKVIYSAAKERSPALAPGPLIMFYKKSDAETAA